MAKKKEIDETLKELKGYIQQDKVVLGMDRVSKGLKVRRFEKVYLAKNCPSELREELEHCAKLADIPCIELDLDNEELGVFCKRNFFVSTLGILRGE